MEGFSYAVKAVCVTSAAACLIGNLTAGMKMHRQVRLLLDLIIAIIIIMPFVSGMASFELPEVSAYDTPDSGYVLELYNRSLSRKTAENVAAVLYDQIEGAGIECENIEVQVNISDDGSIFISRVILMCSDYDGAADMIRSSLGEDTEVINGNS